MNITNISNIDLNLLLVLDAVISEKNTVKAAARLGVSQPAVSHALSRLRIMLKDRLFVRASRGLIPTPRCLEIQKPLRQLIESAEKIVHEAPAFDPKTSNRTFRMATTDLFEQLALPLLLEKFATEAPGITIISRPTLGHLPKAELEAGDLDFAVAGFFNNIPERFYAQKLYQEDFVCIARKQIIGPQTKISLDTYSELRHLVISPQGDLQTYTKALFQKKGIELRYVAGVASFLSPARILMKSKLALTCPRRLAKSFCENFPLQIYELPFKVPPIQMLQVWHEQRQDDLGHIWMRKEIKDLCNKI